MPHKHSVAHIAPPASGVDGSDGPPELFGAFAVSPEDFTEVPVLPAVVVAVDVVAEPRWIEPRDGA